MSLLGSLLKKTKHEAPPEKTAPALGFGKMMASMTPSAPAMEKLQIGSKRKNAVDVVDKDDSSSNSSFDYAGKMTKMVSDPGQAAYMGPNLWDEVLTFGECGTLEFLNAEDFLFETGILLEKDPKKSGTSTPVSKVVPAPLPEVKAERPKKAAVHRQPVSVSSSTSSSPCSSVASVTSSNSSVLRSMLVDEKKPEDPTKTLDTDILQKLLQGCSIPQNVPDTAESDYEDEVIEAHVEEKPPRASPPLPVIAAEINMSDRELHLATVPGEQVFNPKQRRFEHEELRPLPVMRKAKKQFVPEEQKDDKYWERRRKNNVAAKRARDAQRIKMNQIMVRTAWLEKENEKLSVKLSESLAEQEKLKERLSMYEEV
jgi:hypothetical protein